MKMTRTSLTIGAVLLSLILVHSLPAQPHHPWSLGCIAFFGVFAVWAASWFDDPDGLEIEDDFDGQ